MCLEAPNVWLLVKAVQELKAAADDLVTEDDALKPPTTTSRPACFVRGLQGSASERMRALS